MTTENHAPSALRRGARFLDAIRSPAAAATLCLIAIQVGIALVMKSSQTKGSYAFSTSGSITISEFLKLLLSALFFSRQRKHDRGTNGDAGQGQNSASRAEYDALEARSSVDLEDFDEIGEHRGPPLADKDAFSSLRRASWFGFFQDVGSHMTTAKTTGFYILALAYTLINNSIFVCYKLADPGTIQLSKTGATAITALIMVTTLGTKISRWQWFAIALQTFGMILSQYEPGTGATYPTTTYLVLLLQVSLSALSGVYNQYLLKRDDCNLHVDNMVLYGSGAFINLLCHAMIRAINPDEPNFFQGYNNISAIIVVLNNVFIGLAMTAVYKYADAVIKCFASAISTGILLFISPMLFDAKLGPMVMLGAILVFAASWVYLANPLKDQGGGQQTSQKPSSGSSNGLVILGLKFHKILLVVLTTVTMLAVARLTIEKTGVPNTPAPTTPEEDDDPTLSPFRNSFAMIRWNSAHPERIPLLQKYEPFFDTVHISMPDLMPGVGEEVYNMTHDQYRGTNTIYRQIARQMQLILTDKPNVDALVYFHFDAWFDPMGWKGLNRNNIWYPVARREQEGPPFECMTNLNQSIYPGWWGFNLGFHLEALKAVRIVEDLPEYSILAQEWCLGWSDIYYVPRRFFHDYILLGALFYEFDVFHEVAVPTILNIINQSRTTDVADPALFEIPDCWGSCCASNPTVKDLLGRRCGHRIDYLADEVTGKFYDKLDEQAKVLRPKEKSEEGMEREKEEKEEKEKKEKEEKEKEKEKKEKEEETPDK